MKTFVWETRARQPKPGLTAFGLRVLAKFRHWLLLLALSIAPLQFYASKAQVPAPQTVSESQVKAAYLYKFGSYIEWPDKAFAAPDSPLTIGVYGADALADELSKISAGHTVNGRAVAVRRLQAQDSVVGVNVLFIGGASREQNAGWIAAVKNQPILTVTDSEQAMALGSMINFILVDGRVRFEASPKAAKLNNLTISARLLQVAYRIVSEAS